MTNDREATMRALLTVLASAPGPIGTRSARLALLEVGIDVSESSVSRRLRELDERGWTVPMGAKGRVISAEGRRRHTELEFSDRTTESLGRVVDVRDVRDLLDLLHARKAVESAAAADAARHAEQADIDELWELVGRHRDAVGTMELTQQPGLGLHRKIAAIAPNRMLKMLTGFVLAPHLDRVEAVLDIVLGAHDNQDAVVAEHAAIVDAIATGDAGRAEKVMGQHFDAMIGAGEKLLDGESASVVTRLLNWMDATSVDGRARSGEVPA
ncbi:FCD domain-containing protein [Ruania albidiflava]|uniref:FCD domain-containing protein n=1 Tax=Ruania albidiflava TaxID=366586 RepID=UPI000686AA10|nr:FCD domain-containing protein [Ruania albidiflava]